jgi:hypothetical protein
MLGASDVFKESQDLNNCCGKTHGKAQPRVKTLEIWRSSQLLNFDAALSLCLS